MDKVLIAGIERSGIAAARLLAGQGKTVFISDINCGGKVISSVEGIIEEGVVKEQNIEIGRHTEKFIKQSDYIVISPGIRNDSLIVRTAEAMGKPVISEIELAYSFCPAPIVAVTGTSGKTTVVTLIGQTLKRYGKDVCCCGNIGNPFSGEIKNLNRDSIVVLEVSSFQLERIKNFKPIVSIILNISENHLDRHADMDEYINMKRRVFCNQDKNDIVFLNGRNDLLRKISMDITNTMVEFFDEYKNFSNKYNIANEDYLSVLSACSFLGVDDKTILDALSDFRGIEHRLEYVSAINGIDFINDSKATTVSSVEWALKNLKGRIILIAGGRYKGGDFGRLECFAENIGLVIAIGEAKSKIREHMSGFVEVVEENSMETAVRKAFKQAKQGDKVLLSPGCSSFDMFENYEERGRVFKELCLSITNSWKLSAF